MQRRGGDLEALEKTFPIHVRQIDDHAQAIGLLNHFDAEVREPSAGSILPDAVAELVAKIPNRLQRAQSQAIEVSEILNAAAQRHAAFEVEQKFYRPGLDFFRQIAAASDHRDHALGFGRLLQKLVDVFERGLQVTAGILRMGIRIAADSVDGEIDAVANQSRRNCIADRHRFADRGPVELLINVPMSFDNDVLLQKLFAVHRFSHLFLKICAPSDSNSCIIH